MKHREWHNSPWLPGHVGREANSGCQVMERAVPLWRSSLGDQQKSVMYDAAAVQQDNCCRRQAGLWMVWRPLAWWSAYLPGLFVPGRVPVLVLGAVGYAIIAAGEAVNGSTFVCRKSSSHLLSILSNPTQHSSVLTGLIPYSTDLHRWRETLPDIFEVSRRTS